MHGAAQSILKVTARAAPLSRFRPVLPNPREVGLENSRGAHWEEVLVADPLAPNEAGANVVLQVEVVDVLVEMILA